MGVVGKKKEEYTHALKTTLCNHCRRAIGTTWPVRLPVRVEVTLPWHGRAPGVRHLLRPRGWHLKPRGRRRTMVDETVEPMGHHRCVRAQRPFGIARSDTG